MKIIKPLLFSLFVFCSIFGSTAQAALNLPPPADLLNKASWGRTELRDVIFLIQKNIPEFTGLGEISPYMHILPDLQKYSDQFKLEDIYPKAVRGLGENMFNAAQKWMDVRNVNQQELVFFSRYANYNLATNLAGYIEYIMNLETNLNVLKVAMDNTEAIRQLFTQTMPDQVQLDLYFRRILSEKAAKVLSDPRLAATEADFWIQKISTLEGFFNFIELMSQKILALNSANAQESHIYLNRLSALKNRMDVFVSTLPGATFVSLGEQVDNLLMQMIVLEVPFGVGEAELAISLLTAKNVADMTQLIMGRTTLPTAGYVDQFLYLSKLIMNELKKYGLKQQLQEFSTYVQKVAAPVMINRLQGEGQYTLKDDTGKTWYFTIIQSPTNVVYAGISDDKSFINRSFFNVTFDIDNSIFVASQREPDITPTANQTVHFLIDTNGNIQVTDLYSTPLTKKFLGKKTDNFPKYIGIPVTPGSLTGHYMGDIEYLDGSKKTGELFLTVFTSYTLGRLTVYDNGGKVILNIEYQFGNKITDSSIFLVSGQLISGTWNHMRGKIENDVFKGVMMISGRGIVTKELTLRRK